MSGAVSRWLGQINRMNDVAERLLRVQIENRPAIDAIKLYDDPATLFYLDPPYVHEARTDTRAYGLEMTGADHRLLAEVLHSVQGMVALSGYRCTLMDELYSDWHRIDAPVKTAHSCKAERQECLWINYQIPDITTHSCKTERQECLWVNCQIPDTNGGEGYCPDV
jgi:DNA adenine methylase